MKLYQWKQYRTFIVLMAAGLLFALHSVPAFGQSSSPVPAKAGEGNTPKAPQIATAAPVQAVTTKSGNDATHIVIPTTALRSQHFLATLAGSPAVVNPLSVFVDSTGNVYVADTNLNVVKELSPAGALLHTFGTGAGAGVGQFNQPVGVAIAGNDVFITDYANNRVQRFNKTTGAYLSQFGTLGAGLNQLSAPAHIAYNPLNGLLYVAEVGNSRVQRFNTSGVSQGTFGSVGTGQGQFNQAFGIAIDPLGYLYVGDLGNDRIEKFSSTGTYIRTIGGTGTGDGYLSTPNQLAVDRAGFLYVADRGNSRIQKFDWKGSFTGKYGVSGPYAPGFFSIPSGVAVSNLANAQPIVYVADTGYSKVETFEASLQPISHTFQAKWGSMGAAPSQFNLPGGNAVDTAGNLYVADANRIQKFDKQGTFIKQWGSLGSAAGQFKSPNGIAINSANNVFIADTLNNRIQVFDSNGTFIRQWGSTGAANGLFNIPYFVAVDSTYVYVTDYGNDRIQKFDFMGNFVSKWGTTGPALGQVSCPMGIAVDLNRQFVYITERCNNRVQIFTVNGNPVSIVADSVTGPGALQGPTSLATDQRGNVYVVDHINSRIVQFSDNGQYVGTFGGYGTADGQLNFPWSVAIDHNTGQIFVSDTENNRIQRFGSLNPSNDTVGVWRPSTRSFYLRNANTTGVADISVDTSGFALTTDKPLVGDWNGDGVSTVGVYRNGLFLLRDSNLPGSPDYIFTLGIAGDVPIVGDWNADGKDGVGVFRPSNGLIYLKNDLTTGFADYQMVLGAPGDIGVAGDWNGDGQDSPGVRRPGSIQFFLSNKVTNGSVFADYSLQLGASTDAPFTGDWINQGSSGVGVFRPSNGLIYLKNGLTPGFADTQITLGIANDVPVAGYWGKVPLEAVAPMPPPAGEPATLPTPKLAPTFVPSTK